MEYLKQYEIYNRRYFYPSLAKVLPYVKSITLSVTDDITERILCLPLYVDLTLEEVDMISRLLLRAQNN
jgi:dTDP-4-amino-4,6-dideoxygalactose transaminase